MEAPTTFDRRNISRIDQPARGGKHETHGWQFKAKRSGKQQTKFFADGVYGSKEAALGAAIAYRDAIFEEIGEYFGYFLTDVLPVSNTSGILGVHRSESIRQDESIEEVWQASTPTPDGRGRFKAFNISVHGERGAMYKAIEERLDAVSTLAASPKYKTSSQSIANLIEQYLNILIYLDSADDSETQYIISVVNNKAIPSTDKQAIITGRVGQATFRAKLERLWQQRCSVSGAKLLLSASHIKPWAAANDVERLDPFNGLLLSPTYDRAFDQGFVSFENDGRIILSEKITPEVKALAINPNAKISGLVPASLPYLEYHRTHVFRGKDG